MRRLALFAIAIGFFMPVLASAPAHAQATRTWVSGVGDDANPCSRTAPCKTFAGAISKTAASGEINCLDPGGFGGVTITKSISIFCDGDLGGLLVAGAGVNGIIVNGAGAIVHLRGIDFQGAGSAQNGINFIQGSGLILENSVIRNFNAANGLGIKFTPNTLATLTVINSTISDNGDASSGGGIQVSATAAGFARALIKNSAVDKNFVGIAAVGNGTTSAIQMFNSTVSHNNGTALIALGTGGVIKVGSSAIVGNAGAATSGNVLSYGNNQITDNGTDTIPGAVPLH